jgi:hypothetical protein
MLMCTPMAAIYQRSRHRLLLLPKFAASVLGLKLPLASSDLMRQVDSKLPVAAVG